MITVTREVAEKDIEKFATAFRLDPIKRKKLFSKNEEGNTIIDPAIELIEAGMVCVEEDGSITYSLLEPIVSDSGNVVLEKVSLKPKRIRLSEAQSLEKLDSDFDRMLKILNILSGTEMSIMKKMSMDDVNYLSSLTLVFM